jgi:hypothetical protein
VVERFGCSSEVHLPDRKKAAFLRHFEARARGTSVAPAPTMNKSLWTGSFRALAVTAFAALLGTLAVGCAAEDAGDADDDDGESENTGSESSAAMHLGDITRRIKASITVTPDEYLAIAADEADKKCRSLNGGAVGPYAPINVTMTVTVEKSAVRFVGVASPFTNAPIGQCVQKTLLGQKAPSYLGFTRTKTFVIKTAGTK